MFVEPDLLSIHLFHTHFTGFFSLVRVSVLIYTFTMATFSNLEKTLRQPRIIKNVALLLARRFMPIWFVSFVVIDLIFNLEPLIWLLSVLSYFIVELFLLHSWYFSYVLPTHQRKLKNSIDLYDQCIADPTNAYLQNFIETITEDSAWSIVHFGYMNYPTIVWPKIYRIIFNFVVRPCEVSAEDLLVDYNSSRPNLLRDLKYPYEITSAATTQQLQSDEKLKTVLSNLKVKENYFLKILKITQGYINLRGDYAANAFAYDNYLRELLKRFAQSVNVVPDEVYDYRWEALTTRHKKI